MVYSHLCFNNQKKEEEKLEEANSKIMKTNMFTARAMSTLMPLIMLVMNSATILIVWLVVIRLILAACKLVI